jgi:hypothetical protein
VGVIVGGTGVWVAVAVCSGAIAVDRVVHANVGGFGGAAVGAGAVGVEEGNGVGDGAWITGVLDWSAASVFGSTAMD